MKEVSRGLLDTRTSQASQGNTDTQVFIASQNELDTQVRRAYLKFFLTMNKERAAATFQRVRRELSQLGLLPMMEDVKLKISCWSRHTLQARGFVYDEGVPTLMYLLGFRSGVIYLSNDMPDCPTLLGVIRHEFAHVWAWANPRFLKRPWFRKAFKGSYFSSKRRSGRIKFFELSRFYLTHSSAYALTSPAEDFAETFEVYLKYRNSLDRFRTRPGLYRKLMAVKRAIKEQAKELK